MHEATQLSWVREQGPPHDLAHGRFCCLSQQAWHVLLEVGIPSCPCGCSLEMALGPLPLGHVAVGRRADWHFRPHSPGSQAGSWGHAGQEGRRKQNRDVLFSCEKTEVWCCVLLSTPSTSPTGGISLSSLEERLLGLIRAGMRRKC